MEKTIQLLGKLESLPPVFCPHCHAVMELTDRLLIMDLKNMLIRVMYDCPECGGCTEGWYNLNLNPPSFVSNMTMRKFVFDLSEAIKTETIKI